jgi:hypothetical protein
MQVFLIHRFVARKEATRYLLAVAADFNIVVNPFILDSSSCKDWKSTALKGMQECEVVAVFDIAKCMNSENAAWEIAQAQELNKPLILLDPTEQDNKELEKLQAMYHHDDEFNSYFKADERNTEDLYKVMVDSSEQLIQRRQVMNAFFIAAIGSLLAFAGALSQFGSVKSQVVSFFMMAFLGVAGLFLCNSWRNLIDNYGKLNKAKFRVILKLEQSLPAQIFSAEWAALGKGLRPQKYKSFTSTENKVPLWFAILIFVLLLCADFWFISS